MSALAPQPLRRSARLAAKAQPATPNKVNHVFGSASLADLKKEVPSAPKKAARDISHLFTPAVPPNISIPMTPVPAAATQPSSPKKAVYRSLADMVLAETDEYREKLMRENIHTLIDRQMEAAKRCEPNHWADEKMVFLYSFIVAPLLDSLTKPYVNWDKVNVLDLYHIMFFWRPDARAVSINMCMSDKFMHDWNICRYRILDYGLVFPSSNQ